MKAKPSRKEPPVIYDPSDSSDSLRAFAVLLLVFASAIVTLGLVYLSFPALEE